MFQKQCAVLDRALQDRNVRDYAALKFKNEMILIAYLESWNGKLCRKFCMTNVYTTTARQLPHQPTYPPPVSIYNGAFRDCDWLNKDIFLDKPDLTHRGGEEGMFNSVEFRLLMHGLFSYVMGDIPEGDNRPKDFFEFSNVLSPALARFGKFLSSELVRKVAKCVCADCRADHVHSNAVFDALRVDETERRHNIQNDHLSSDLKQMKQANDVLAADNKKLAIENRDLKVSLDSKMFGFSKSSSAEANFKSLSSKPQPTQPPVPQKTTSRSTRYATRSWTQQQKRVADQDRNSAFKY